MNEEKIKNQIDLLIAEAEKSTTADQIFSQKLFQGTLGIMVLLYGSNSSQVQNFTKEAALIRSKFAGTYYAEDILLFSQGALQNIKAEIQAGLIGSLHKTITGEVLTDFLQLARVALDEGGDDAKNVAAVLTAALFEDTIRRLAVTNGIPHIEKLQNVIAELKDKGILQGSQVGIASAYLNFRNNSLHAQWDKVGREAVSSALGFVEQLLIKHFS